MECRITGIKRQAGLGLAEYVVAMGVAVLLVGAVCAFSLFTGRSMALFSSFADSDLSNRRAVDLNVSSAFSMSLNLTLSRSTAVTAANAFSTL